MSLAEVVKKVVTFLGLIAFWSSKWVFYRPTNGQEIGSSVFGTIRHTRLHNLDKKEAPGNFYSSSGAASLLVPRTLLMPAESNLYFALQSQTPDCLFVKLFIN